MKSREIELNLSAALAYLSGLFKLDPGSIEQVLDPNIEKSFLPDRVRMLAEAAENGANRLHVAVNDRLTVKDRSILFDGKGPMMSGQVSVKEDGSVLIHPDTRALVVAELTGLGLYGSVRYELLLRLENAKAAATEVRVVATQRASRIPRTVAARLTTRLVGARSRPIGLVSRATTAPSSRSSLKNPAHVRRSM